MKTYNHSEVSPNRHIRELYGYFSWRFNPVDNGYESAWKQALDQDSFFEQCGLTTVEKRHPLFMKNRIKRCQWVGSSWPFAGSPA